MRACLSAACHLEGVTVRCFWAWLPFPEPLSGLFLYGSSRRVPEALGSQLLPLLPLLEHVPLSSCVDLWLDNPAVGLHNERLGGALVGVSRVFLLEVDETLEWVWQ